VFFYLIEFFQGYLSRLKSYVYCDTRTNRILRILLKLVKISRKLVRYTGKLLKIKSKLILIPFISFVDFFFFSSKCCRQDR
jgi:hypothetical protein